MSNVAYLGPLLDYSGYGEANRHFVAALHAAGVGVDAQLVSYAHDRSDFGEIGKLMVDLIDRKRDYRTKILHTTPDEYQRFYEPGKYHIGHFFWETDKVPTKYAEPLMTMDEIWTGSEANKAVILSTGVEKPVYIFPQPIETDRIWPEGYGNPEFKDRYMFYSIFEWTDRKNPEALLRAYYEEFGDTDNNVGIIIKTYFRNFTLSNKRMIRAHIEKIKSRMGITKFPPVYLYLDLMDRRQIERLHSTGDCFVSAHRGEGWGVPQVEAALCGNPVISTGYGGCHEYFKDGLTMTNLPYDLVPVRRMDHTELYTAEQNWAEVDPAALRAAMRDAYDQQEAYRRHGQLARGFVQHNFNFKRVGGMLANRLKEIEEGL